MSHAARTLFPCGRAAWWILSGPMWFDARSLDVGFTDTSPFHILNEIEIEAPPARIFDLFATGEGQEEWFQDFVSVDWTSGEPHGVGSERVVELKMLSVKERFVIWERGKRLTFCIYAITLPLVHAMMEDLQFEPTKRGGTRFVWRVHYDPRLLLRAVHPVGRAVFGRLFKKSQLGLKKYAEAHPA
jgi:uncharacterized protein YndB with AHSA1/START domain